MTVNVNEADAASTANALIGIGISRARAIVDYRDQYGRLYCPGAYFGKGLWPVNGGKEPVENFHRVILHGR